MVLYIRSDSEQQTCKLWFSSNLKHQAAKRWNDLLTLPTLRRNPANGKAEKPQADKQKPASYPRQLQRQLWLDIKMMSPEDRCGRRNVKSLLAVDAGHSD